MSEVGLGDQLYQICMAHRSVLFTLARLVQLAYSAFDFTATSIRDGEQDKVSFQYPLGLRPDETAILGDITYDKTELVEQYRRLGHFELPLTSIYHLVTHTEACLGDLVRAVVRSYPKKIGASRKIDLGTVLGCTSLEAMHIVAADSLLNDLAYKSPREFAEAVQPIVGTNLLELPSFHQFIELKATRDVHVHNRGRANDIYLYKAGALARAKPGEWLPVTPAYFLRGYEHCLQLGEALEAQLLETWSSPLFEAFKRERSDPKPTTPLPPSIIDSPASNGPTDGLDPETGLTTPDGTSDRPEHNRAAPAR